MVLDHPALEFSRPARPIGPTTATVFLNNPWTCTDADIDDGEHLAARRDRACQRIDGTSLGNVTLLFGTNIPVPRQGDRHRTLYWTARGLTSASTQSGTALHGRRRRAPRRDLLERIDLPCGGIAARTGRSAAPHDAATVTS
jgi:hypothetical protein